MSARNLVVVSGYYGFGNLGDEAILEEIVTELKRLVEPASNIVVLSQNPQATEKVFGVRAVDRWQLGKIQALFSKARLFVSGGGGLYQDTSSVKSVVYYAGLGLLAKLSGAPTVIYAQGVGPLKSPLSVALTRTAMKQAQVVSVRDTDSKALLTGWGIDAQLTADPVWSLAPSPLPQSIETQLQKEDDRMLIGLSLRESPHITMSAVESFAKMIVQSAPYSALLVPMALQKEQDGDLLAAFLAIWTASGRSSIDIDLSQIERPSQWVSLLSKLDMVIGMRFHALLMALKSGVPTLGLAYDPKVSYLMQKFQQPCLNLANGFDENKTALQLCDLFNSALGNLSALSNQARETVSAQETLACQNFEIIARILKTQGSG